MNPDQTPQMPQAPAPQGMPTMPLTPTDPRMPPPTSGVPIGGDQPISPEEKQTLLNLIAQIKSQLGVLQATSFASSGKSELLRKELLKQVFEKLQLAGVELSSRESVAAFIMRLQEQNPELAAMFEKSMDVLIGKTNSMDGGFDPGAMPPPPTGADALIARGPMEDPNAPFSAPQIG